MSKGLKFFFIAFFVSFLGIFALNIFQENLENYFYAQISQPLQNMAEVKIPEKPDLELQAKAAISVRVNEVGKAKILFKKNINQPLPIASLTKLMTALVVLENPKDYDFSKSITISEDAANQENVPNYGNLKGGQKLSLEELLDLILIYSSNDAAYALAEEMKVENFAPVVEQSSLRGFVEKMNQKAKDLGLENTYFVNPTGLDPEKLHYNPEALNYFNHSTARDLVKLAQYILKEHPLIFEISRKEPFYLIKDGIFDLFLTQEVVGGKTGYTDEAGGCILFLFRNERRSIFINLILGAPSSSARITEMQKLINYQARL